MISLLFSSLLFSSLLFASNTERMLFYHFLTLRHIGHVNKNHLLRTF
jgi:hypothetical protein